VIIDTDCRDISISVKSFLLCIVSGKFEIYKSAGIYEIQAELIQTGGHILCYETHKLINSILTTEELFQKRKESIPATIYNNRDTSTIDHLNCKCISLLSTSYKKLSNIMSQCLNVTPLRR
jgi:hypothetical protein